MRSQSLKLRFASVLLCILLAFTIPPGYSQTGFDQTFRHNFYSEVWGGTAIQSDWFTIFVPFRTVSIQLLEVHVRVTNNGPGTFAFDISGLFHAPPNQAVVSILPTVFASQSDISQTVGIGWVEEGWTAEIWFMVDFLAQRFEIGPQGTPLLNADRVNYYDNTLWVGTTGNTFSASIRLASGAVSNAKLRVEDASIRVKGVSSGTTVPELVTPSLILMLIVLSAVLIIKSSGRARNFVEAQPR